MSQYRIALNLQPGDLLFCTVLILVLYSIDNAAGLPLKGMLLFKNIPGETLLKPSEHVTS